MSRNTSEDWPKIHYNELPNRNLIYRTPKALRWSAGLMFLGGLLTLMTLLWMWVFSGKSLRELKFFVENNTFQEVLSALLNFEYGSIISLTVTISVWFFTGVSTLREKRWVPKFSVICAILNAGSLALFLIGVQVPRAALFPFLEVFVGSAAAALLFTPSCRKFFNQ